MQNKSKTQTKNVKMTRITIFKKYNSKIGSQIGSQIQKNILHPCIECGHSNVVLRLIQSIYKRANVGGSITASPTVALVGGVIEMLFVEIGKGYNILKIVRYPILDK